MFAPQRIVAAQVFKLFGVRFQGLAVAARVIELQLTAQRVVFGRQSRKSRRTDLKCLG